MRFGRFFTGALVAVMTASALPAAATVYMGRQTAGPTGSGDFTLETDGTLGVLSTGNIVSFSLNTVIEGIAYHSVSGGPGSDVTLFGSGLSATADSLIFDFTSDTFFGFADFVPGNTGFCVDGALAPFTCSGDAPSLSFFATIATNVFVVASERRTGVQVIAIVPEPAGVGLFAAGLILLGGAVRWRRAA